MSISKIRIRGEEIPTTAQVESADSQLQLKQSFRINGPVRGISFNNNTVTVQDDDLLEFIFEDGTTWIGGLDTLEELFPDKVLRAADTDTDTIDLPLSIQGESTERGIVTDIALKFFNIFVKKVVNHTVHEIAKDLENKTLGMAPRLYRVDRDLKLHEFTAERTDKPYLLLLHGTNSSTKGSFDALPGTPVWKYIQDVYGSNVLAFQHRTLTESPLENVLQLVNELPEQAELHLLSHSRGGLLGEILCRFCTNNELENGFSPNEISYLQKCGRTREVDCISAIRAAISGRQISVKKFIRVACPANGTMLASRRLEHFLNITCNLVGLATGVFSTPIYIAVRNLIAAVVDTKNNINVLPGIEAMNPESPFIIALNSKEPGNNIISQPLAVISGNCDAAINLKGLLIIASKLFYTGKNDLVVNTNSMYLGAKRSDEPQFFFYEGRDIDHFGYFRNTETKTAILNALQTSGNAAIPGFSKWAPEVIYQDRQAMPGLEGGEIMNTTVKGSKPILLLLPGIMGSTLHVDKKRLWIDYSRLFSGHLTLLRMDNEQVAPAGLIATAYKEIYEFFSRTHDVVTFAYDWRSPLETVAEKLKVKIGELLVYKQPIKVVAHSMGGVLFRDFMIKYQDEWKKLNASPKFKLVLLGAPLGGSFRIPAVLFGMDPIIRKLNMIDIFNTKKELLTVFSRFQGLLNLLPLSKDPRCDFGKISTWEAMRDALDETDWPLPHKDDLKAFDTYRNKALEHMDKLDYSNIVYIAGKDKATVYDYRIEQKKRGKELVFLYTTEGDQSVTWDTGIPQKLISNDAVYYANVTHGALANDYHLFKGIADIIEHGYTNLLSKNRPVTRGERTFTLPPAVDFDTSERGVYRTMLGYDAEDSIRSSDNPLQVSISQGDLKYAQYPVLAGHFDGDGIINAEHAIDVNLKGALLQRHKLGLYPGKIGSTEVLVSGQDDFKGAIIVGLGDFGGLTAFQLTQTVEQGVSKYLINLNSKLPFKNYASQSKMTGITSLIIGCGYGGLTVGNSVRAILQAVANANNKVKQLFNGDARLIENVEFIEQYEDRALSCFYHLNNIAKEENRSINISVDKTINRALGSKLRINAEYMDEWWNRITVKRTFITEGDKAIEGPLTFSASTGGAREELRELYTSNKVIEKLLEEISTNNHWTPSLARTVFELMIPNDFKEQLKKQWHINWILDKNTAGYPWELLQDSVSDARPFCINAGMIRQLATEDYRIKINNVVKDTALIIASPNLSGYLAPLPGALEEGRVANRILIDNGFDALHIPDGEAHTIIESLYKDDYKILHLAGHGIYDPKSPDKSGMVIGNGVYLTSFDIGQMSSVPELVFINCCYLGKVNGVDDKLYRERYKLAANLGTQMIENGVKVAVVTGWAVDDEAAANFTKVFYERMFAGDTFGDAVRSAREVIYNKFKHRNNTWGAYQCYGDPFYRLRIKVDKEKMFSFNFVIAQQAEIVLKNLLNDMENGDYTEADYLAKLDAISKAVDKAGIRNATITELEGMAYVDLYDYDMAIFKFESIEELESGSISFEALEKYYNVKSKRPLLEFKKGVDKEREAVLIKDVEDVITNLKNLLLLGKTGHRYSLTGSAYKRKAFMSTAPDDKAGAYLQAASHYYMADGVRNNKYKTYTYVSYNGLLYILSLLEKCEWDKELKIENTTIRLPQNKECLVAKLKERLSDVNTQATNGDYWRFLEIADIHLCIMLISYTEENEHQLFTDTLAAYQRRWSKAGSKGRKMAEVEHLEFLDDALQFTLDFLNERKAKDDEKKKKDRNEKTIKELGGLRKCLAQLKLQLLKEI
ncbi:Lecithin:cholesterol acyltransferase [Chitinophaga sp. YR627]|uniref:DUF7379 domain-containing protein n=1 Tax=Chitinophaga sp. YR627 TaxID=1881041 RepID=UPI0008E37BBF|nr:CHAT domain-containing protein [Chitinophaga sp. YR627]SFO75893.1 Lecithin:cholesterol acyltransferase [Chitinophaga sp. YR627]